MGCGSSSANTIVPTPEVPNERTKKRSVVATVIANIGNFIPKTFVEDRNRINRYTEKFSKRVTAKYEFSALIGRGNFSRVFRVENRLTQQAYAIKTVDGINGRKVCESELNVLRNVRHMYVIQLIEVFYSPRKLYMVMELATGGELFERIIATGSFTERDAARVLCMVCEGLRYLHSVGITHRDLKPENLLYFHPGEDSKILITDFGLSACRRSNDEFNMMNTICGTPEYIAPEMLARKTYTNQVDMWAIGVITFILISGTFPFDSEDRTRLYRLILRVKYSFIPGEVGSRMPFLNHFKG